jgi:hypothetical protein
MLQEDAGQHELNDQIDSQLQKRFDSPATFFGRGIVSTRKDVFPPSELREAHHELSSFRADSANLTNEGSLEVSLMRSASSNRGLAPSG